MSQTINLSDSSNFNKDKKYLIEEVKNYLNNKSENNQNYQEVRTKAAEKIKSGNIIEAINDLEDARDIKRGINTFKTKSFNNETPILIRDARNYKKGIPEGVEASEMIVLASFEAAKDIIKFDENAKNNSDFYQKELHKMAIDFFDNFASRNQKKSDKDLFYKSNIEMVKIGTFLTKCGIENAKEKISQALHFQNFKQGENYNPVTISSLNDKKGNQNILIEADVAFKGLTNEQKKLYDKIINEKVVSDLQISLMKEYREQFFSGKYNISAQLINTLPGIRNSFEELTFLVKNSERKSNITENDLELVDDRKRAGALPTIINNNKKLTEEITASNARQANILMGNDKVKLHWNSLNTDMPIVGQSFGGYETDIVKQTRKATKNNYINFTATPLNRFRRVGVTSDIKGIKEYLNTLANSLNDENLKQYIKPSNFIDRIKNKKSNNDFEQILSEIENQNPNSDFVKIIRLAKSVNEYAKKTSTPFRINDGFDKENISLKISTKFGRLTKLVNRAFENEKSDLFIHSDKSKTPLETIVTSCKSAKDRTGLNMFYRMAKILKDEVKISFAEICDHLHFSGHIEYLPGSFRVGGGTPGCYQLQSPVLGALPASEKQHLEVIVGPFAHNNKGPKPKLFDKIKDYFFEKKINFIDKFGQKYESDGFIKNELLNKELAEFEQIEKDTNNKKEVTLLKNPTAVKLCSALELDKRNLR